MLPQASKPPCGTSLDITHRPQAFDNEPRLHKFLLRHQNQITRIADVRKLEKVRGFFCFCPKYEFDGANPKVRPRVEREALVFPQIQGWELGEGVGAVLPQFPFIWARLLYKGWWPPSNIRGGDKKSGQRRMRVCGGEGVMEMEGGILDGSHSSHLLPHMFTPLFPCLGDLVGTHIGLST